MERFRVPAWVNQRQQTHGSVELLGRTIQATRDEVERLAERIAILTEDGKCDEESAQRHALLDLQQRRQMASG